MPQKRFLLTLIKPSHYDDEGYVIQWFRSAIPSNTLAVLNGLALDCKERRVLGDDVDIEISRDGRNATRGSGRAASPASTQGRPGMVALVGVQSNQFPRAMDLGAAAAGGGRSGVHGRIPCLGLPVDAAGDHAGAPGGDGSGRSRCSPAKPRAVSSRCLRDAWNGRAEAALQLHGRSAVARRRARCRFCRPRA